LPHLRGLKIKGAELELLLGAIFTGSKVAGFLAVELGDEKESGVYINSRPRHKHGQPGCRQ